MYLQLCSLVSVFIPERLCTDIGAYTELICFSAIVSYAMASAGESVNHLPRTVPAVSQDFLYLIFNVLPLYIPETNKSRNFYTFSLKVSDAFNLLHFYLKSVVFIYAL